MPRRCCLLLGFALTMLLMTGSAVAATLTVNTTADELTPNDGLCSLREAINAAGSPGTASDCGAAAFGANTIALGPHTYPLGSGKGQLAISTAAANLTIIGTGMGVTAIDASGLGDRVMSIPAGPTVRISGLTITGGHAAGGAAGDQASGAPGQDGAGGGAILNAGALTVNDVAITNSFAGSGGDGGTFMFGIGSPGSDGGAGGTGGDGGAILNTGTLTLNGATIEGNHAGSGGAGGQGEQGNTAGGGGGTGGQGGAGGGIANDGGSVTITASTIVGNTAGSGGKGGTGGTYFGTTSVGGPGGSGGAATGGGGVWADGGTVTVTNSTIASNSAGDGGTGGTGGFANGNPPSTGGAGGDGASGGAGEGVRVTGPVAAKLLNATVSGNSAGTGGSGGVGGSGSPSGAPGIAGATGVGGGVAGAAPASVTLQNTLLAANPLGNCAGSVSDGGHNLSFSDHTCPSTFSAGDPKLGTLRDNGGPTPTMALGGGSAAIDQIPTVVQCPATDQRGVARPAPAGGACDIGAYEVAAPKVAFQTVQGLSPKSVAVHVAVTANSGSGTVLVEYGRSTSLGHRTAARPIGGVNLARVSFTLRGLNLRQRRYYLRLVADTPDGETKTVELKLVVPILRSLRVNPRSFRTGGPHASTTLSYTDTRKAFTRFEVQRRQHGKWVTIGTFVHRDRAGRNRLSWRGRVGGHRLRPGHYRLLAVASANRVIRSPTITVDFRIRG